MKALLSGKYRIETAENGQVAYEYIKLHHQDISCILLDLLMPVMDGFQLLELLHRDEVLSEIPVIITTETGSNGELRALNLGAHSFVAKPYHPDVLRHHVKKAVEERFFIKLKKEYMQKASTLYEKAYRDELTGLLNRYGLKAAIERLAREKPHAVISLDLDGLKKMNDQFGHVVGDELLKAVAAIFKKNTRGGDILARLEGDEFVMILCGMGDENLTRNKLKRLCESIESTVLSERQIQVSCRAGITIMKEDEEYQDAYRRADEALYEVRRQGKGHCRIWGKMQAEE